jgi:hypothetical protein
LSKSSVNRRLRQPERIDLADAMAGAIIRARLDEARTVAFGASRPLPCALAKVASPNRQRPFRLEGRNWSSCPYSDLAQLPTTTTGRRPSFYLKTSSNH